MCVEPSPKCVNRELNYQIGIRSQDSHFSKSDGAPPTSMARKSQLYFISFVSSNWVVINHQKGEIESAVKP